MKKDNANFLFGGSHNERDFVGCQQRVEEMSRDEEIKVLNLKMQIMEKCLHGRMHKLESIQSGLRMMMLANMIFFVISIAMFFF